MKKILAVVLVLTVVLIFAACGGTDKPQPSQQSEPAPQSENQPESTPEESTPEESNAPSEMELSDWLKTKTGKFYSKFGDKMYMEYETEYDGNKMTVISATSGGKTYSESKVDGQTMGVTIMDGDYMYVIDHSTKLIIKMSMQSAEQQTVKTMIEEDDVNLTDMVSGTREIDGKTYDTEEWSIDGGKSILCFDGDNLAYILGEFDGTETSVKVLKTDSNVDESLFVLPEGYQEMSY